MEFCGKLTLTITSDYCHHEVIELFKKLKENRDICFFTITSDIDNLGEYIAYNGRAKGQNLVDLYTNIVAEYISIAQNKIKDLVFIPAGEEISIFGLVYCSEDFTHFIHNLDTYASNKINDSVFAKGSTGITFGGKIINERYILDQINKFVDNLNSDNFNSSKEYYNILEQLRTEVSPIVDIKKFKSLSVSHKSEAIFLRNLIYLKLLNYKKETRELLKSIALNKNNLKIDRDLHQEYGLTEEKIKRLQNFKDDLISKSVK